MVSKGDTIWVLRIGTRVSMYTCKEDADKVYSHALEYYKGHAPCNSDTFTYAVYHEKRTWSGANAFVVAFSPRTKKEIKFHMEFYKSVVE